MDSGEPVSGSISREREVGSTSTGREQMAQKYVDRTGCRGEEMR